MKPEVKKLWLEALRSGNYSQARGMLHESPSGGYCCSGVLRDVYRKETGKGRWASLSWCESFDACDGDHAFTSLLPRSVVNWAGLEKSNPDVAMSQLSDYNDTKEYNFNQIADLIDRYL